MCAWGKGSWHHCSPATISYYGHTLEGLYQLVSQITYALRQLNKSVKGAAEVLPAVYVTATTDSTGAKYEDTMVEKA